MKTANEISVQLKFQDIIDNRTGVKYNYMLVIDNIPDLEMYFEKAFQSKIRLAWDNLIETSKGKAHINNTLGRLIYHRLNSDKANGRNKSILETTCNVLDQVLNGQADCIRKYGKIYVNKMGAYFPHSEDIEVIDEFMSDGKNIIFPSYTKDDIRITKWEGGKHYYAYVGDFWVYSANGDKKFDTEREAMQVASAFLWNLNNKQFEFKNK